MNILLLGAGGNAGLNFVKSIKKANQNTKIFGLDIDEFNLISSNSDEKILLPKFSDQEKIYFLKKIIKEKNIDAVHAQPDKEVLFLAKHREELGKEKIFNHSVEKWNIFFDKLYCQKKWSQILNLAFNSYSLVDVINDNKKFDFLKQFSGKVWFRALSGAGSKAALPITKYQEAVSWADYWINNKQMRLEDFMLSEFLPGKEFAVQTFWFEGKLIQAQARQRVQYFFANIMPSGQSSTPSVALITKEENIYETAKQAILSLDEKPHGIYCVDMKENYINTLIPTEINYGRFFTTSDFFADVGVNTPYVYINSIINNNVKLEDIKINSVSEEYYWLRGLDKEPFKYLKK